LTEDSIDKGELRAFITTSLIHNPDYPLDDGEQLISGGLIDTAALEELARFIEETYGVWVDPDELSTDNIDTLTDIIEAIKNRMA
jgi:acyl carrier protein